jgi:hypothetical protein
MTYTATPEGNKVVIAMSAAAPAKTEETAQEKTDRRRPAQLSASGPGQPPEGGPAETSSETAGRSLTHRRGNIPAQESLWIFRTQIGQCPAAIADVANLNIIVAPT